MGLLNSKQDSQKITFKEKEMRKIIFGTFIDSTTFTIVKEVKMITEDGTSPETVFSQVVERVKQQPQPMIYRGKSYMPEDYSRIEFCNKALLDKGYLELTTEEADFMLSRINLDETLGKKMNEGLEPESLQRLAGFQVQKIITPV